MNLSQDKRRFLGGNTSAGGAGIGASVNSPAQPSYTVGEIGFGASWSDDEPSLEAMHDAACQTIVRLECEADELRAEVAMLREQARIIIAERDQARGAVQGYRDAACRASCRDKESADRAGGDVWSNL